MNTINFSHRYNKLESINTRMPVRLLEVFTKNVAMLSAAFREYDTKYFDEFDKTEKNFELRNGNAVKLILIFIDCDGDLFTTIRDYNKEKVDYYINQIGCDFEVKFV